MSCDWNSIAGRIGEARKLVRICVIEVDGSAPRDAGASMLVWRDGIEDTIGGGRLEYEAIGKARELLEAHREFGQLWRRETCIIPLGPALGQCCGGVARLLFEVLTVRELKAMQWSDEHPPMPAQPFVLVHPTATGLPLLLATDRKIDCQLPVRVARVVRDMLSGARPRAATHIKLQDKRQSAAWFIEPMGAAKTPLYIFGAGHVGRAIVASIAQVEFDVHWVDTARDRFPDSIPSHVTLAATAAPYELAKRSASSAFHLVMTYSHALDLAICQALLARGDFTYLGLIGSQTKRARFLKRLHDGGIAEAMLARLTCPIGISGIRGKEPATIAISVAAQLVETLELSQQQTSNSHRRANHV